MKTWRVEWVIDIDAESPREAAEQALAIQRRDSHALVFKVKEFDSNDEAFHIDLDAGGEG